MSNQNVIKTRVVTKFFIIDIINSIKNALGMRLTKYEDMIMKAQKEIWDEIKQEKIELKWYRYEISQLTNGAMAIMLYGERK
jgi:uncharacterized protein YbjQ (UPF0145 family)